MAVSTMVSATVMAADEGIDGFYDIGTKENVTIVPYAGETAVTAQDKNIDSDADMEVVYVGSDKMAVTFSGATANDYYGVILVEGSDLPTKDTEIFYINQETAASTSVAFNVYPKLPAETKDMTLYISSSAKNAGLVSVPMSYAVNATEATPTPSHKPGDVNEDVEIDVKDVIAIRQYIAGGYGVELQ